jgi:toxin ParE1/3/4
MNQIITDILHRAESWPQENQEELAEVAREIEARRSGVYRPTAEELHALDEAERSGVASGRRGGSSISELPPGMKIEYSNLAVADLRKISADTRRVFGGRVAEELEARIRAVIERISMAPLSAPEVQGRPGLHVVPLRRYPFKIFYRVLDVASEFSTSVTHRGDRGRVGSKHLAIQVVIFSSLAAGAPSTAVSPLMKFRRVLMNASTMLNQAPFPAP